MMATRCRGFRSHVEKPKLSSNRLYLSQRTMTFFGNDLLWQRICSKEPLFAFGPARERGSIFP